MPEQKPKTLICTVGVSLFFPNLVNLPAESDYPLDEKTANLYKKMQLTEDFLKETKALYDAKEWKNLGKQLGVIPGSTRLCGAEINSITDIIKREYCQTNPNLILCHSATTDGRNIATILHSYYQEKGHNIELQEIEGLQDNEPEVFRGKGLRNLAQKIGASIHKYSAEYSAINATGGYKAQIAIAVLIGQALGIPVYYKHERFSEIIAFPPMPISLDFNLWLEKSNWLSMLDRKEMLAPSSEELEEDWDEKMETLIERVPDKDKFIIELSPTGQIFYEAFKNRFQSERDQYLPPDIPPHEKKKPTLSDHSWGQARTPILNFLQQIIDNHPYVRTCKTTYWNPDLPSQTHFRKNGEEIQGIYSNGTWTVKFTVETSASTIGQKNACIADMNHQLE